jgi:hypothetical protein
MTRQPAPSRDIPEARDWATLIGCLVGLMIVWVIAQIVIVAWCVVGLVHR